jgi:hypothetical protein
MVPAMVAKANRSASGLCRAGAGNWTVTYLIDDRL